MTVTNSYLRQPTKLDYASPTQFKFNILKLPNVEYFCTAINVPGEKLTYQDLNVTFLVDENLENYRELHNWLTGLGFPEDHTQFASLQSAGTDRFPTSGGSVSTEIGKQKYGAPSAGSTLSDATLMVLTNKNNPVVEVRFKDIFPTSIGPLQYNQQETDISYLSVNCVFKYEIYTFAGINSSTTTISHT